MTSRYGPYELVVDNVDYGSHEQALTWLGEQYAGPLNVATGYVGLEHGMSMRTSKLVIQTINDLFGNPRQVDDH